MFAKIQNVIYTDRAFPQLIFKKNIEYCAILKYDYVFYNYSISPFWEDFEQFLVTFGDKTLYISDLSEPKSVQHFNAYLKGFSVKHDMKNEILKFLKTKDFETELSFFEQISINPILFTESLDLIIYFDRIFELGIAFISGEKIKNFDKFCSRSKLYRWKNLPDYLIDLKSISSPEVYFQNERLFLQNYSEGYGH